METLIPLTPLFHRLPKKYILSGKKRNRFLSLWFIVIELSESAIKLLYEITSNVTSAKFVIYFGEIKVLEKFFHEDVFIVSRFLPVGGVRRRSLTFFVCKPTRSCCLTISNQRTRTTH